MSNIPRRGQIYRRHQGRGRVRVRLEKINLYRQWGRMVELRGCMAAFGYEFPGYTNTFGKEIKELNSLHWYHPTVPDISPLMTTFAQ